VNRFTSCINRQVKIKINGFIDHNWNAQLMYFRMLSSLLVLLLVASGCASYGVIHNQPIDESVATKSYSVKTWSEAARADDLLFILAFSGGGTRAAAMSYGVLQELRDTKIVSNGSVTSLLNEVDHISSVSGGSFTSAYYGLYGDRIFEDFEDEFLRKNVQGDLTLSLVRPIHWFGSKGRTERAIEYYNKNLFHDATFADMMQPGRPMIVINASDLARGVRFSFIQDYFDMLCSDLSNFPVASAVAASSAVPVVFNPVVVENYSGCDEFEIPPHLIQLAKESDQLGQILEGLKSYNDKENRKFIHFVDGGITDNMGLRAMTDVVALSGGPDSMVEVSQETVPERVVFLSVNASTEHNSDMDQTAKQPSMLAAMNAMTDVQLHRYNAATIDEAKRNMEIWAAQMSTPEKKVSTYFIDLNFKEVPQPQLKLFLNKIPTSFDLSDEQVDALITSARSLLLNDPDFKELISDISEK